MTTSLFVTTIKPETLAFRFTRRAKTVTSQNLCSPGNQEPAATLKFKLFMLKRRPGWAVKWALLWLHRVRPDH